MKTGLVILSVAVLAACLLAWRIYSFGNTSSNIRADAAVVLGAAVWYYYTGYLLRRPFL